MPVDFRRRVLGAAIGDGFLQSFPLERAAAEVDQAQWAVLLRGAEHDIGCGVYSSVEMMMRAYVDGSMNHDVA